MAFWLGMAIVFLLVLAVSATAWLMSVLLIAMAATVQKKTFFLDKLGYFLECMSVYIKAGLSIYSNVKRQTKT
jgi:Flp pilus assembly protein TadB